MAYDWLTGSTSGASGLTHRSSTSDPYASRSDGYAARTPGSSSATAGTNAQSASGGYIDVNGKSGNASGYQTSSGAGIGDVAKGGAGYGQGSAGGAGLFGDATAQNPISGVHDIFFGGFNAPSVPDVPGMPTFINSVATAPASHPVVWLVMAAGLLYVAKRRGWF